jgi:proteasome beta subunit
MEPKPLKGTTTLGIVCNDGIILASERKATMGYFIATQEIEKIFKIDDHIGMTIAGAVMDGQKLAQTLVVESKLFRIRNGRLIGVEAATALLSNLMYQYKMYPFYSQIVIGGIETDGTPKLYSLDPWGGVIAEDKYTVTGSGCPMAYAILDDLYEKKDVKETLHLAVKAINSAIKRDTASGGVVNLVTITKEGFKQHKKEETEKSAQRETERKRK